MHTAATETVLVKAAATGHERQLTSVCATMSGGEKGCWYVKLRTRTWVERVVGLNTTGQRRRVERSLD